MPIAHEYENIIRDIINYHDSIECNVEDFFERYACICVFSILWNVFEGRCIKGNSFYNEVGDVVKKVIKKNNTGKAIDDLCNSTYSFFKLRYSDMSLFQALKFRKKEYEIDTKNFLEKNTPSNEEKLKAIFYIIYRHRNNLFHGLKEIDNYMNLESYQELFKQDNTFLNSFIKLYPFYTK